MPQIGDTEELRNLTRKTTVYSSLPGYIPRNFCTSLLDECSREMIQERANVDLNALPKRNYFQRQDLRDGSDPDSDMDDEDFVLGLDLATNTQHEQEIADEHRLIVSGAEPELVENDHEPPSKRMKTTPSSEQGKGLCREGPGTAPVEADHVCNRCRNPTSASENDDPFRCHRCHKHYTHRRAECSMQPGVNWIAEGDMEKDFWCFECWFAAEPRERVDYEVDFCAKWATKGWKRPHTGRYSVMVERLMGLGH